MSGDKVTALKEALEEDDDGRQRSRIGFPYNNLNDAIEVARAVHSNVGSGSCDDAQLAPWMNQSAKSSGYRVQLSAAKMFGLIETTAGQHRLSALGQMIVDSQQEKRARAEAFLKVPLYSALYNKYKGTVIPPTAALLNEIVALGVSEKQRDKARQVFERSAEQAGFFASGRERLVMPGITANSPPPNVGPVTIEAVGRAGGGQNPPAPPSPPTFHPFVEGLVKTLPPPESDWATDARVKWLQAAANIFDLIYTGGTSNIKVEKQ